MCSINVLFQSSPHLGPIVRIAPNELSFSTVDAFKTIYGHASKGKPVLLKGPWYDRPVSKPNIVSTRDPQEHSDQRRQLANAFSARGLRDQAEVVYDYENLFVQQLEKHAMKAPVDIAQWYNWFTFDVIGDLAFGEPFGALAQGE